MVARVALLGVLAGVVLGCLTAPSPARADVVWLCRPGADPNPCQGDLTTRYFEPDGSSRVETTKVPAAPPVDCFYVYPTVSNQPTPNATKSPDPEVMSIAKFQAQRFSARCRVFAPLYRQVTAAGVSSSSQTHDTTPYDTAYADVREAWLEYLKSDNHGRGVILIGHSQGSRMLRALIRREIDPRPEVRKLLVSAIIPGANATVARGRRVGGDFNSVPACDTASQTGCVMSWSTFNKTPPDNARFGRTDTDPVGSALGLPGGPDTEVLCTDPAALAGTSGRLDSLVPSEPFAPGVIAALLIKLYGGPPPSADTPWLQPTDHYTGRCETSNHANVLMIAPVAGARMLTPSPDDTWGVHLVDLNLAEGNLLTITAAETRAWLAAHRPLAAALRARRVGPHRGRLTTVVSGPPGARVRVALRRGTATVGRRSVRLSGAGRRVVHIRVRRAGSYRATVTGAGGTARSRAVRLRLP
ncbi:MAG: hypothetical protein QOJ07_3395 [Thermoleophilaceae bacterium]|nr:hypothetical protein [Thermoleophilaceae bacterium]